MMPVFPDRRMFRLHDSVVDPNAPGAPLPPVGSLISVNREQLWVGSLQEQLDVRLVIEEWDGAPPQFGDTWQEEAKCRLYLRGYLSIDEGSAGKAIHGLRLASGVGNYAVRVYASNREEAARRYAELYDAHRNPLADEFQQAKKQLEGLERYLIQLWREYLPLAAGTTGRPGLQRPGLRRPGLQAGHRLAGTTGRPGLQAGRDYGPAALWAAGWAAVPAAACAPGLVSLDPEAWATALAEVLALALAEGRVAGAELLAGFLPGPALSLAWPVPVLETVVTG